MYRLSAGALVWWAAARLGSVADSPSVPPDASESGCDDVTGSQGCVSELDAQVCSVVVADRSWA